LFVSPTNIQVRSLCQNKSNQDEKHRSLLSILYERILFVQWDSGIDNQAICQHYQPDIASSQRFADKVRAAFV
jgi:hypothetical protein